jgi:aldehyde:ferredoxin oxidoreductase
VLGGYVGKLLHVDLTSEKVREKKLPDENVLRKYVGCFALGLKSLYDALPLAVGASDPGNPLIFMTGPLTGVGVPAPTNTTLVTLNYDTRFTVGRSHSHGFWGPNLKMAGYDGVTITGAAADPVYVRIDDGDVRICDAKKIRGSDTHETEDLVKTEMGRPKASVAAIGPAGENLCAGALIQNDKNHSFSHSGVGAVMGSKNLKAIAVHGTREVNVANKDKIRDIYERWVKSINDAKVLRVQKGGIPRTEYKYYRESSMCTGRNLNVVSPPEFGVGMSTHKITPKPCYGCFIACSYDVEVTSGPHKGYVASLSGGGENMEGAASMAGVYESGTVFYLTDLYDRLGFESSTAGCSLAMAFECFEKGLLTQEDTGGLELRWGDAEAVEKLLRKVANREDWIGNTLAKGPKRAAETIGGDAPRFAVHIKGSGMNLHDWRGGAWGTLFGQFLGGGSGWPAPGADTRIEPDVGYPKVQDPFDVKDKPEAARKCGIIKYWNDSIGTCWFSTWGVHRSLTLTTEAINAVTGWDITPEDALLVGERAMNLERVFNVRRGLTPEDDYEVAPRLLEAPSSGRAKGKTIKPYLRGMVMEYYRLMGWDEKTGKPYRSTLEKVGLEHLVQDIWA